MLFLGFGAQQFADKIADHTRRGIKGALKRRVLLSRAYGYRKASEPAETNRAIDETEARIVRRIFEMTPEGKSSYAIATLLNAEGVSAPTGGTWDASTIRGNPKRGEGILYNPIYIGRPQVCRNTGKYHPVTSERKTVPSPEETVQAHFKSLQIIPDALWEATRDVIAAQRAKITNTPRDARRNTYLLSGLMTCGCCGHKYIKDSRTSYRCNEARKNACSNRKSISRKRLEKRVFDRLRYAFRSPEMLAAFEREIEAEKAKQQKGDLTAEIRRLETELKKVERAQEGIFTAIEEGGPYAKLRDRLNTWVEKEESLKAQITTLKERMSRNLDDMPPAHIMFEQAIANMESILSNPDDVDQAHQHLKTLIHRITLTPDPEALHRLTIRVETDLASLFLGEQDDAEEQRSTYLYC